jgi:hypothetical protein
MLNIRADYSDNIDLNSIAQNLSLRQCSIVTDKSFDINILSQLKNNISCVIYNITKALDMQFISVMENTGIKYVCVFDESVEKDDTILSERRYDLIDFCGVKKFKSIPDVENFREFISLDNLKFKTNRILLANQKVYTSRAAQLEDKPITELNNLIQDISDITDKNQLKQDLDYLYIYSQN